jgi:hypothetical protein
MDAYDKVLSAAMARGDTIYSAAYIMPSGAAQLRNKRKHRNHLALLEMMMADGITARLKRCRRMVEAFDLLRSYPTLGDFLAYQFATDINYSEVTNFSEMDFVVPGPGAKSGIRKCFSNLGGLSEEEVIFLVAKHQDEEFDRLGIRFERIGNRPLQLIDCQNLFCETDKYARIVHPDVAGIGARKRIKQQFRPNGEPVNYMFPPKWGLNQILCEQWRGQKRKNE